MKHWLATLVLGLMALPALATLPGCEAGKYLLNAFEDDRIPARYKLEPVHTLVLVDDPRHHLGDPALIHTVAAWTNDTLRKNVEKITFVPVREVVELAQKTGDDFADLPVDQIGSELGAAQVIYITIESAGVTGDPGLFKPEALARVNVIDVATGRRLFPLADQIDPQAAADGVAARGEPARVQLHYTTSEHNPLGERAVLMRTLAQQIGVAAAQLFYKHEPPTVPRYTDN